MPEELEQQLDPIFPNDLWYILIDQANVKVTKIFNNTIVQSDPYRYNQRSKYKIFSRREKGSGWAWFQGPFASIFECKLYITQKKYDKMNAYCDARESILHKELTSYNEDYQREVYKSYAGECKKIEKLFEKWGEEYPEYFV